MPLETLLPQLDDRRYDDLMTEVRTRIARYTPEWTPVWTDTNESDPGITMVEVFAWLAELLAFRMNQVPALNYVKFLQLIGLELTPRQPALAELTFPVKPTHAALYVTVPPRTQVSGEAPDGGPPVIFETERALFALTARLTSVQSYDGISFDDLTLLNEKAEQGFTPFGPQAQAESALLLGFDKDLPPVELNLAVLRPPNANGTAVYQCGITAPPGNGPADLRWEYWSYGDVWRSLSLLKDETRALTRAGHVYLKPPATGSLKPARFGHATQDLYWIRARVARSEYERPPQLLAVRTNTVAAQQAETIRDEVLGGSNGRRDQVFRLASVPVLAASLRLEVNEGSGFETWTRQDDFFASQKNDHHFVLNPTTGEVRFGDGVNGAIPTGNISNPGANVVAREYRTGGGKRGNLPAKALRTLLGSLSGVDDNQIGNLLPAHSGRDEESLAEARKRAPRAIKSNARAVTAEDFEYFALQAANVKRARALPLMHPAFPGVQVPGVVTVIVVPDSDARAPQPSEDMLRTVCAYLDQRRLLTTEHYIIRPTYQQVEVRGEVVVHGDADPAEVKEGIERALHTYFHPLKGGEDGLGWPFGGTIFFSRVYQHVFTVTGVQSITRLLIVLDGEETPACTDIPLQGNALLYSERHEIVTSFNFDE
ncbi:MAG: putative baseplate assembly protein [Blastocatellia bacterium]